MLPIVEQLNFILALGTLTLQVAAALLLILILFKRDHPVVSFVGVYGVHIVFLITLSGVALTLLYSEVFGFLPCGLCWLQRVFLYPQAVIAGIALYKKDQRVADYLTGLSIFGLVVALYQHYLQIGGVELIDCPAVGAGGDCAKRILFEFGYITFPLMSATLFAAIIVTMIAVRRKGLKGESHKVNTREHQG